MTTETVDARKARRDANLLTGAIDALSRSLTFSSEKPDAWAETVDSALAALDRALRVHRRNAAQEDGVLSEVDETRPTLSRRVGDIQEKHWETLAKIQTLRSDLLHRSPQSNDLARWRSQSEALLAEVREISRTENELLQESVNTDIGGGD